MSKEETTGKQKRKPIYATTTKKKRNLIQVPKTV